MIDKWYNVIEKWNEADHEGVKLYDFGDGVMSMPVPDFASGSYPRG